MVLTRIGITQFKLFNFENYSWESQNTFRGHVRGHEGKNSDNKNGLKRATKDNWNGNKRHRDGLKVRQQGRKGQIQLTKTDKDMGLFSIRDPKQLKFRQGTNVPLRQVKKGLRKEIVVHFPTWNPTYKKKVAVHLFCFHRRNDVILLTRLNKGNSSLFFAYFPQIIGLVRSEVVCLCHCFSNITIITIGPLHISQWKQLLFQTESTSFWHTNMASGNPPSSPTGTLNKKEAGKLGWVGTLTRRKKGQEGNVLWEAFASINALVRSPDRVTHDLRSYTCNSPCR